MEKFFTILCILWPLVSCLLAAHFYRRQNGSKAWTGGPISVPKAMWLSYTVTTWFFMPIWLLLSGSVPQPLIYFFYFHLLSWWIRGPLELVMIYKWLNWTPKYGMGHDLFHILGCFYFLQSAQLELMNIDLSLANKLALIFCLIILASTVAEIWFAYLFFTTRSNQEKDDNIYFASDDPKWKFINRATASVVYPAYLHLFIQSLILLMELKT